MICSEIIEEKNGRPRNKIKPGKCFKLCRRFRWRAGNRFYFSRRRAALIGGLFWRCRFLFLFAVATHALVNSFFDFIEAFVYCPIELSVGPLFRFIEYTFL